MNPSSRARVSFHLGERQELAYKLMGFGIPIQLLPTTESGVIKTKNHTQWFKTRQLIEKHASNTFTIQPGKLLGAIECPALNDVLYERTKPCIYHPGNSRFKGLIEARKEEHAMLSQTGKRDFAWSIVEEIEKRGGRFLNWDRTNGFWVQLQDRSEIRLKVATSLRDFNKHSRALNKVQTVASVCKVSFENGQELKKRRVVVSDDESSQPETGVCEVGDSSKNRNFSDGCLPAFFDFEVSGDLYHKSQLQPDLIVSSKESFPPFMHVVVVRTEDIVMSGSLYRAKLKYANFKRKTTNSNPSHGPYHYRSPSKILWRTIRGMVPHKICRGAAALDRLKAFEGTPPPFDKKKRMVVPAALKVLRLRPERRFCRLGDLSKEYGWKYQNIVSKLEAQRKVKSEAFYKKKLAAGKSRAEAEKEAVLKLSEADRKILEDAGYLNL